jgi:predicted ATPase
MIKSISFKNFKGLRDATLPLGRFTLIVGPNASGKSTAMEAIALAIRPDRVMPDRIRSVEADENELIEIKIVAHDDAISRTRWQQLDSSRSTREGPKLVNNHGEVIGDLATGNSKLFDALDSFRCFSFDPKYLSNSEPLTSVTEIQENGANLTGALYELKNDDERYERFKSDLRAWFPEFDQLVFAAPEVGKHSFGLRTVAGHHRIMAADLSDGTLVAMGFLALAYLPTPPRTVCFEEPEHGIHPRLLRNIQEAMYRLAYPADFGDERDPVQVIATTHSPYLLDLYRDHPEEVVIAHKDLQGVHFERLADQEHINEYLQDASLGEVWYSGILGGVPVHP